MQMTSDEQEKKICLSMYELILPRFISHERIWKVHSQKGCSAFER